MVFAILGVAFYFLLPQVTQATNAFTLMLKGNYWLLGLAVLLEMSALLCYASLTRFVFHSLRAELRLWLVLRITLAGFAASRIFSVGGIGGFVVTYKALARRGVSRSIAVVAVATQQFFNYIVLWIIFFSSLLYLLAKGRGSAAGATFAIVCIGLILGHLAYLIYLYNHPTTLRRRARQLAKIVNRARRRTVIAVSRIDEWVDNLRAGIRPMTARRGAIRTNALFAAFWWSCDILCLFTVFQAYGYTIHLAPLLVAHSMAYTVATFVPTPGGLGTVEALLLALFAGFRVPADVSVASVLVYRLINFWLPIPFGTVAYLTIRKAERAEESGTLNGTLAVTAPASATASASTKNTPRAAEASGPAKASGPVDSARRPEEAAAEANQPAEERRSVEP